VRVEVDPKYFRPNEVDYLCGNPIKANTELGWRAKTSFEELAKIMYENDLLEYKKEVSHQFLRHLYED
jgi:GDPmannose 4,6-dehydratase